MGWQRDLRNKKEEKKRVCRLLGRLGAASSCGGRGVGGQCWGFLASANLSTHSVPNVIYRTELYL